MAAEAERLVNVDESEGVGHFCGDFLRHQGGIGAGRALGVVRHVQVRMRTQPGRHPAVAQGDGGGGIDEVGFEADFLPCFDGDGPGSMSATCRAPVSAEKPGE